MVKNTAYYSSDEYKKKQREAHLGTKNPMYGRRGESCPSWENKESRGYYRRHWTTVIKTLRQECSVCGTTEKLVTHHIDFNYKNNALDNITIVCRGCHNKIHKTKVRA